MHLAALTAREPANGTAWLQLGLARHAQNEYAPAVVAFERARPLIDRFTWGRFKRVLGAGRVYTPYLSLKLAFDTQNTTRGLRGTGIVVPRVQDYFANLFRFAFETDWGKNLPAE